MEVNGSNWFSGHNVNVQDLIQIKCLLFNILSIFNLKITMIGTVVALRENFTDIKISRLCFKVKLSM